MELVRIERLTDAFDEFDICDAERIDVAITCVENNIRTMLNRAQLIQISKELIAVRDITSNEVYSFEVKNIQYIAFIFLKQEDEDTISLNEFAEIEICTQSMELIPIAIEYLANEIDVGYVDNTVLLADSSNKVIFQAKAKRKISFGNESIPDRTFGDCSSAKRQYSSYWYNTPNQRKHEKTFADAPTIAYQEKKFMFIRKKNVG